jgi:Fur family ferric uptake transcriptional regulator
MRFSQKKIATLLSQHGYKFTSQRRIVIRAITSSQDHLTPAAIYEKVHQQHPNIGLVTIYRTLDILTKLELICELHSGGSCHSYVPKI